MDTQLKRKSEEDLRKRKIIQLEGLLESMIEIEEYELCIQLRDIIKRLKETKNKK